MKTIDVTSRLGQFAWRQITPSTIPLPVIFRHDNREEYLCVQMINIHYLSKFPSECVSYYMKQYPLQYFSITESEAELFQTINQFHSNGYLGKSNRLDYSKLHLVYITPFLPFVQFYQFMCSNLQSIKNNNMYFSSKYQRSIIEQEKSTLNNKYSTNKMVSPSPTNECKSSSSYCRTVIFRGKEIMSYITTSSMDSNKTILCLSIKDIVETYFPSHTHEEFIQLCRLKQIIRYKPDKSTNSDLSLRLINIQQLEEFWNFFTKHLLPKISCNNQGSLTRNSPPLVIDTNDNSSIPLSNPIEQSSEISSSSILPQPENLPCPIESIQSIDDEVILCETQSVLNQLIEIIEQQEDSLETKIDKEQNQLINVSPEEKQEEEEDESILLTIENKIVKRKRRQSQRCPFVSKRRKRRQQKDQMQWWVDKYSIQPISILLDRVAVPID